MSKVFEPEIVISQEEVDKIIKPSLYDQEDFFLELGTVDVFSAQEEVCLFMEQWVQRMDVYLQKARKAGKKKKQKYPVIYQRLFAERGCTFNEYSALFDSSIPEENYHHYPAFQFFCILNDEHRRKFITGKSPVTESYTQDLVLFDLAALRFFFQRFDALIPYSHILRHVSITGKSGSGKSEILKLMFYRLQKKSQAKKSKTLICIDPHGDLVKELKSFRLNKEYRKRLVYVDPFLAKGYTSTINPLQLSDTSDQNIGIMSEQLVKVFDELLQNSAISDNMRAVLEPCISVLMRKGNSSLAELQRFMDDSNNDDLVELGKQSPIITHKDFFRSERGFGNSFYGRTKSSIFTKLQTLLNSPVFYNLVCGESTIDLEKEINSGKVILFNLAKGTRGSHTAEAFGRFLVGMISGFAQKRESLPKHLRVPTILAIDEWQNYATDSTREILEENRKYGLHFILANQHIRQVKESWQNAIRSNTDVKIVGRNDDGHFGVMAPALRVKKEELLKLKEYHFYVKSSDRTAIKFKSSAALVNRNNTAFYLDKEELEKLDSYLVHDSGYYRSLGNGEDPAPEPAQDLQEKTTGTRRKWRFKDI